MNLIDYIRGNLSPGVVSCWVPGGPNRAMNLIKPELGGQCYGTHPNVPVLPNLINPSVGWVFDGNDYLDINSNFQSTFRGSFSIPMWIKPADGHPLSDQKLFGSRNDDDTDWIYATLLSTGKINFFYESNNNGVELETVYEVFGDGATDWGFITFVADSIISGVGGMKIYANNVEIATGDTSGITFADWTSIYNLFFGAYNAKGTPTSYFEGYITLPLIANKAWSQQQVENFYLATRGLFSPRIYSLPICGVEWNQGTDTWEWV